MAEPGHPAGVGHPDTLRSAADLAAVHGALGNFRRAEEVEQDVLARYRRVLGEDHPDTFLTIFNLAVTQANLGQLMAARRLADQAWDGSRGKLGAQHPRARRAREFRDQPAGLMGRPATGRKSGSPPLKRALLHRTI